MDKKLFKSILIIILYTIILVAIAINIHAILGGISSVLSLLSPVFIGFGTAFVLNRPYTFFYKLYSTPRKPKKEKEPKKERKKLKINIPFLKQKEQKPRSYKGLHKALSLVTVYILFFLFIAFLLWLVIPEITVSISQIYEKRFEYSDNLTDIIDSLDNTFPFSLLKETTTVVPPEIPDSEIIEGVESDFIIDIVTAEQKTLSEIIKEKATDFLQNLPNYLSSILPDIVSATQKIASSVMNIILGLVMSIYMLASKESLTAQIKRLFYAYVPKKFADETCFVLSASNDIFSSFVNGRLFDALIVGMLCFIGMSIFGFQYTLLISVLVAVTNVIPIFGPFIGAVPSVLLLLFVDPMQAVWFVVFIVVLQQIDGNVIGPKVVGESIGLPAWWVMFSITIGGGLFGIMGMLAGVPTFAVIYRLLAKDVNSRLTKKGEASTANG